MNDPQPPQPLIDPSSYEGNLITIRKWPRERVFLEAQKPDCVRTSAAKFILAEIDKRDADVKHTEQQTTTVRLHSKSHRWTVFNGVIGSFGFIIAVIVLIRDWKANSRLDEIEKKVKALQGSPSSQLMPPLVKPPLPLTPPVENALLPSAKTTTEAELAPKEKSIDKGL